MDRSKRARGVVRSAFTRIHGILQDELKKPSPNMNILKVNLQILEAKQRELDAFDRQIFDDMLDTEANEQDFERESTATDEYTSKLMMIKEEIEGQQNPDASNTSVDTPHTRPFYKRKFKLPEIELKKFGGDLKEWLHFWSSFKKIDEDPDIVPEDKFQYLVQATIEGSRARELIDSFPPTGENYKKALDGLKARFGRDDMLVEVYVRELLVLVLKKALKHSEKMAMCSLYDKLESQLRALDSLGVTSDKYAAMLYPLVESCMPEELLRAWQRSHLGDNMLEEQNSEAKGRLTRLMNFLRAEVENEERINLATAGFNIAAEKIKTKGKSFNQVESNTPTAASLANIKEVKIVCIFCDRSHASNDCIKAQKMTLVEKRKLIQDKKGCYACLKLGHFASRCKLFVRCLVCRGRHMAVMCPKLENKQDPNVEPSKADTAATTTEALATQITSSGVMLQTLVVNLEHNGKRKFVRVVVDTGSQKTYILQKTAREMGYKPQGKEQLIHSLFGGTQTAEQSHNKYKVQASSMNGKYRCNFDALDQKVIVGEISYIRKGPWTKELFENKIEVSDMGRVEGPIEILIGADIAGKLFTGGVLQLKCGLAALETKLGWTLVGKIPGEKKEETMTMTTIAMFTQAGRISDLWELDQLGIRDPVETKLKEEKELEIKQQFLSTIKTDETGRYEVSLLWKENQPDLPPNKELAVTRLHVLTKRLQREDNLEEYDRVLKSWAEDNVIEEIDETKRCAVEHYLPHRHVIKENSTTRLRPVFDASARSNNLPSLNQCLEKGPNLIELIPAILLRFRLNKIGVIADIKAAFLQISVRAEDRDYLRFLWWSEDQAIKTFRHTRVVFGLSCSPYILAFVINHHLQKTLEHLQSENSDNNYSGETVVKLLKSFYVDNCVASVHSKQELDQFICESREIMRQACMNLRGWEHSSIGDVQENDDCSLVLGLKWTRNNDALKINLDWLSEVNLDCITKRFILSTAQKLFDPIGFLCPITVYPKLILQRIWASQCGWDEEVPKQTERDFRKWYAELEQIKLIQIPRWLIGGPSDPKTWSIHTFCDASKTAYATVIFLRSETEDGVKVQLVQAKSRVAPLKKATIPRLELLAATIGARVTTELSRNIEYEIPVTFWTDSTTVITWIQRQDVWAAFVNNRVKEIRKLSDPKSWRHIAGKNNPADLPSRGCSAKQFIAQKWWEGPLWLKEDPREWPEVNEERKKTVPTLLMSTCDKNNDWMIWGFSKYEKIIRLVAWMLRFINNCRRTDNKEQRKGMLAIQEIQGAEKVIIKHVQKSLDTESSLSSFCTYEDPDGILRLKTKITNRDDSEHFRNPTLLPSNHAIVKLLILQQHEKMGHAGTQLLLNALRENYWVIRGRRTIRNVLKTCTTCRRYESRHFETDANPLPANRVRDALVFEVIGVDFAGPLYLKSGEKCYICLFTCAVYRAVHLELVKSLSTESFIFAVRRFIARRGRPNIVYSDNGTNFVGTNNLLATINWEEIQEYATAQRFQWFFNPPSAAWWGGWWERLIRLLKDLLKRILGRSCLWYEEMMTILCDCEATVNSRPLTYISESDSEFRPLTPAMFLKEIEEEGVPDFDNIDHNSLNKRLRYQQKLREELRGGFRSEYLGQLIQHANRRGATREIKVGEIVLVGSDNLKRIEWPLARIVECLPGRDGVTRVVRLKTTKGELIRPVQRLYPLEIHSNSDPNDIENRVLETLKTRDRERKIPTSGGEDPQKITRCGRPVKTPRRLLD